MIAALTLHVLLACAPAEKVPTAVARIGSRTITHEEIRCGTHETPAIDHQKKSCRDEEQRKLDAIVLPVLIEHAAEMQGIVLSQEDVSKHARSSMPDSASLREMSERFKALAAAVERVHDGSSPDSVFQEDLAPKGIPRAAFDGALRAWKTREATQKVLKGDVAADAERQVLQLHRLRLLRRELANLARTDARTKGVAVETRQREIWERAVRTADVVILDEKYRLPAVEEMFR